MLSFFAVSYLFIEKSDTEGSYEEREHVERLHYAAFRGELETCKNLVEVLKFDVDSIAADGSGRCILIILMLR